MNFYNENCPKTAAWLRELIKEGLIADGVVDERSITEIKAHELDGYCQCHFFAGISGWSLALRLAGWPDNRPVWTGSCPCQPFSTGGKTKRFEDQRDLWPVWLGLIKSQHPTTVFGEQVSRGNDAWIKRCQDEMELAGYAFGVADMVATSFSPQERQRFYFVAHSIQNRLNGPRLPHEQRESVSGLSGGRNDFPWDETPVPRNAEDFRHAVLLSDGLPGELDLCGAFGNAIVPQVAAAFILACEEAIADMILLNPAGE